MIPVNQEKEIHRSGVGESIKYEINAEDQSHILAILRDRLYSNKIGAVCREYGCNAVDAHVDAGIADRPIKVTLPTILNPVFSVRDYGKGLSPDDIQNVFRRYGRSTKRTSNKLIGALGIGAKSGHAYNDTFTIISHHAGVRTTYTSLVDETNVGEIIKMGEQPTDETGVEIIVPVRNSDIERFKVEAQCLYVYFDPLPIINTELKLPEIEFPSKYGYISNLPFHPQAGPAVAVMGGVPYRIDLVKCLIKSPFLNKYLTLKFEIGSIDVSANREELEYTDRTIREVQLMLNALMEDYTKLLQNTISQVSFGWEKRKHILRMIETTGISESFLSESAKGYLSRWVNIFNRSEVETTDKDGVKITVTEYHLFDKSPVFFSLFQVNTAVRKSHILIPDYQIKLTTNQIYVSRVTKRGFNINRYLTVPSSYIIFPNQPLESDEAWDAFLLKLNTYFKHLEIDGIPMVPLESLKRRAEDLHPSEVNLIRMRSLLFIYNEERKDWVPVTDTQEVNPEFYFPIFRYQVSGPIKPQDIKNLHRVLAHFNLREYDGSAPVYAVKMKKDGDLKLDMGGIPSAQEYFDSWLPELKEKYAEDRTIFLLKEGLKQVDNPLDERGSQGYFQIGKIMGTMPHHTQARMMYESFKMLKYWQSGKKIDPLMDTLVSDLYSRFMTPEDIEYITTINKSYDSMFIAFLDEYPILYFGDGLLERYRYMYGKFSRRRDEENLLSIVKAGIKTYLSAGMVPQTETPREKHVSNDCHERINYGEFGGTDSCREGWGYSLRTTAPGYCSEEVVICTQASVSRSSTG